MDNSAGMGTRNVNKYFFENEAVGLQHFNEIFWRCGTDCGRNAGRLVMAVWGGRNCTVDKTYFRLSRKAMAEDKACGGGEDLGKRPPSCRTEKAPGRAQ